MPHIQPCVALSRREPVMAGCQPWLWQHGLGCLCMHSGCKAAMGQSLSKRPKELACLWAVLQPKARL